MATNIVHIVISTILLITNTAHTNNKNNHAHVAWGRGQTPACICAVRIIEQLCPEPAASVLTGGLMVLCLQAYNCVENEELPFPKKNRAITSLVMQVVALAMVGLQERRKMWSLQLPASSLTKRPTRPGHQTCTSWPFKELS